MWDSSQRVKVRIAPSPTGEPHVGTAYVGLFNLAWARQHDGLLVLRIEDTDQERSTKESEDSIIESLDWLDLNPDEGPCQGGPVGPYRQSERSELYRKHALELVEAGKAYRCFCTKERLLSLREKQKKEGLDFGYDGHCRELSVEDVEEKLEEGLPYVIRLKMPQCGETVVSDYLRGDVKYQNELIDDQILLKSDGFPTYHLANVVDDHLMGVTHVIRAEEWIPSTPKHVVLYEAFSWLPPTWIHLPLLRNADKGKSKISKRKNPVSLAYYQKRGFLPEALLNYLSLMGWSFPGEEDREIFSLQEFLDNFDMSRVSLGGPVFDLAKLEWMNGVYIRALPDEELCSRLYEHWKQGGFWTKEAVQKVLPLVKERMSVMGEFDYLTGFYHGKTFLEVFASRLVSSEALDSLKKLIQGLRQCFERKAPYWNRVELQNLVSEMAEEELDVALLLFDGESAEKLPEKLFMRGKSFSLKICSEAANTLKKIPPKKCSPKEMVTALDKLSEELSLLDWKTESLETLLNRLAEELNLKKGTLFMPIRIAVSGRAASPGLFETMEAVGRARCLKRLDDFSSILKQIYSI